MARLLENMYQMLQPIVSHLLSLYLMVMAAGLPLDISTNVTLNPVPNLILIPLYNLI